MNRMTPQGLAVASLVMVLVGAVAPGGDGPPPGRHDGANAHPAQRMAPAGTVHPLDGCEGPPGSVGADPDVVEHGRC